MSGQTRPKRIASYWQITQEGWRLCSHEINIDRKLREIEITEYLLPYIGLSKEAILTDKEYEKPDVILKSDSTLIGVELSEVIDQHVAKETSNSERVLESLKQHDIGKDCFIQINIYGPIGTRYLQSFVNRVDSEYKNSIDIFNNPNRPPYKVVHLDPFPAKSISFPDKTGLMVIPSVSISADRNLIIEAIQKKAHWSPDHLCDSYFLLLHEHEMISVHDLTVHEYESRIQKIFKTNSYFPFSEVWYVYPLSSPPNGEVKRLWKRNT